MPKHWNLSPGLGAGRHGVELQEVALEGRKMNLLQRVQWGCWGFRQKAQSRSWMAGATAAVIAADALLGAAFSKPPSLPWPARDNREGSRRDP